jgi:hypothetical protein
MGVGLLIVLTLQALGVMSMFAAAAVMRATSVRLRHAAAILDGDAGRAGGHTVAGFGRRCAGAGG